MLLLDDCTSDNWMVSDDNSRVQVTTQKKSIGRQQRQVLVLQNLDNHPRFFQLRAQYRLPPDRTQHHYCRVQVQLQPSYPIRQQDDDYFLVGASCSIRLPELWWGTCEPLMPGVARYNRLPLPEPLTDRLSVHLGGILPPGQQVALLSIALVASSIIEETRSLLGEFLRPLLDNYRHRFNKNLQPAAIAKKHQFALTCLAIVPSLQSATIIGEQIGYRCHERSFQVERKIGWRHSDCQSIWRLAFMPTSGDEQNFLMEQMFWLAQKPQVDNGGHNAAIELLPPTPQEIVGYAHPQNNFHLKVTTKIAVIDYS